MTTSSGRPGAEEGEEKGGEGRGCVQSWSFQAPWLFVDVGVFPAGSLSWQGSSLVAPLAHQESTVTISEMPEIKWVRLGRQV